MFNFDLHLTQVLTSFGQHLNQTFATFEKKNTNFTDLNKVRTNLEHNLIQV